MYVVDSSDLQIGRISLRKRKLKPNYESNYLFTAYFLSHLSDDVNKAARHSRKQLQIFHATLTRGNCDSMRNLCELALNLFTNASQKSVRTTTNPFHNSI